MDFVLDNVLNLAIFSPLIAALIVFLLPQRCQRHDPSPRFHVEPDTAGFRA